MHQTKQGNQWFFGMKIHAGSDVNNGDAHTVSVTPANASEISQLPDLLREDDHAVFGDRGYVDNAKKRSARQAGVFWGINLKTQPKRSLGNGHKVRNPKLSGVRGRVEHPFRIIKRQYGYVKTRYRVLAKNAAQVFTLMGLANLYLKRRALLA